MYIYIYIHVATSLFSLLYLYSLCAVTFHLKTGLLVRLCFADEAKSPPQHKTTVDWTKHIQSVDESEICTSKYPQLHAVCILIYTYLSILNYMYMYMYMSACIHCLLCMYMYTFSKDVFAFFVIL